MPGGRGRAANRPVPELVPLQQACQKVNTDYSMQLNYTSINPPTDGPESKHFS